MPVIVVDDQVIVGYDQRRLTMLFDQEGTRRPTLGVSIADAARIAGRYGNRLPPGAYVGRVTAGSVAEGAGLRQGDVITELGSHPVRNAADVRAVMAHHRAGDRISLTLNRGGCELRLVVKI